MRKLTVCPDSQLQELGQPPKELAGDAVSWVYDLMKVWKTMHNIITYCTYYSVHINKCQEALTSSPSPRKHSLDSSFSFSLQVLTLTQSHLICQEVLRQRQQSSAPSCDEVKMGASRSSETTWVTRCASVTAGSERTSYVRRPSMLFSVKQKRSRSWDNRSRFQRPTRNSHMPKAHSSFCLYPLNVPLRTF